MLAIDCALLCSKQFPVFTLHSNGPRDKLFRRPVRACEQPLDLVAILLDSLNLFRGRNTNQEHGPEARPVVRQRGLTALFQIENVPLGGE